jgi:hypothetical protein
VSIELRGGFGYWNERGDLVLDADAGGDTRASGEDYNDEDDRFVRRF